MLTISRTAEPRLVETLSDIRDQSESWVLVVFNLNQLMDQYKSDYQVRIAVNLINDLLKDFEGAVFVFADSSIGVLCNHLNATLLNKVIFQLRYLYMDDPLAYTPEGKENDQFCTQFRLAQKLDAAVEFATKKMMLTARGGTDSLLASRLAPVAQAAKQVLFSATRLVNIERDLSTLDISKALRRQPICAFSAGSGIRKVFDEVYINIGHLRELLKADVDFFSNKWLFKYLTRLLDERMLDLMKTNPSRYLSLPISININVETLLSDAFNVFDAALNPAQKVSVVFEVQAMDIFADINAFAYARAAVQKKGYRLCVDGLTPQSFVQLDRDKLKVDLLKLQWNADAATDLSTPENRQLVKSIESCGGNRIILCRCDAKPAVDYGKALGLALFQGRYLDSLLDPQAETVN